MNVKALNYYTQLDLWAKICGNVASTITTTGSSSRVIIDSWIGPIIPKGAILKIIPRNTDVEVLILTTSDIVKGATDFTTANFTPEIEIPIGSKIFIEPYQQKEKTYKTYNSTHVHMYHTGTTHGNDMLPNFTQFNFNVNSGSVLTNGVSKPNRWGSQFAFWIAPANNTKIERIISQASSDGGLDEDWALRYWVKPVDANGSSDTSMGLVDQQSYISVNDQNHVFTRIYEPGTPFSMDQGDALIITMIKTGSSQVSSTKFYADIEIITSYYIK